MSRKMKLDFTGVESFERAEEGKHICKIAAADLKQSQGGNDMIVVAFEVTKGTSKGARVYENYPLAENALWKLKGLLQAIGMKADGKVQLDLDKLVGKVCEVTVFHEEYEGKTRAKVDTVAKIKAQADADEDEDDEDVTEEAPEEEEDEEEEEKPAKKSKKAKKPAKKQPEPEPEDEDEDADDDDDDWDDEDDEDEEPEEKPAPKKKAAKKADKKPAKKAKKSKPEPEEDDEDEDDDDDWDEE